MKVVVKKKDDHQPLAIHTEFIKLQDALKYANIVYSGGEAKQLIIDGEVTVNGESFARRPLYVVMVKFITPVLLVFLLLQSLGVFHWIASLFAA